MDMPTWKKFFDVVAFVLVFSVPVILYLMEKAGASLSRIFVLGWISVAAAAIYLVLSIPWVWSDASIAMRVWRVSFVCSIALLLSGYGAIKIWPPASATSDGSALTKPTVQPVHEAKPTITMTRYGSLPNSKMFAVIKVESPPPIDAPFHLLLICRVVDSTVDEMEDPRIEKSSLRTITGQTIEMTVSHDFLERAYKFKFVNIILALLPDGVDPSKIVKLSDVPLLGGQVAINNGFVPTVYPVAKPKNASPLSNDTNTQIGTAQGPVAIAPHGIANAAPNFGTQSVYNAPPARHLTDEQKSIIASVIQGKPCKIAMMGALSNIEDAQAYALELRAAFKSAGCDVPEGVAPLMALNGTWYGIKVSYYDPGIHQDGEKVYTPFDTPQGLIIKALDDAHLGTVLIGTEPNFPKDAIHLSVGGHPK
jgi:hypothetical protein